YTRFPEPGTVPEGEEQYRPAVYRHRMGEPQSRDARVFGPVDDPEIVYEVDISSDHRWLAVTAFKGASERSAIAILEEDADGPETGRVRWRVDGFAHNWSFIGVRDGDIFLRTTQDAPRGHVVRVDAGGTVHEVVAESEDSLIDTRLAGERLALLYLHQASSRGVIAPRPGISHEGGEMCGHCLECPVHSVARWHGGV